MFIGKFFFPSPGRLRLDLLTMSFTEAQSKFSGQVAHLSRGRILAFCADWLLMVDERFASSKQSGSPREIFIGKPQVTSVETYELSASGEEPGAGTRKRVSF